jgi:hypothetical protein
MDLKLGKKPATFDARDLRLATYLSLAQLPPVPRSFGHGQIVGNWGMLGNDQYGDCVWAGAAHETELWTRESKTHADASFTPASVLSDYAAVTGFSPADPNTDQGTDMRQAAGYRRATGVVDSKGRRHKITAYMALSAGNPVQLAAATYIFGAAGVGIEFPSSAMDQFNRGQVWDVVPGSPIEGGHYISCVGRVDNGNLLLVTWGKLIEATPAFISTYMDEGFAYYSTERLAYSISPEGLNKAQLSADLAAITTA